MYGNVVPLTGKDKFIRKALDQTIYVRLFVNDLHPDYDTELSDITECSLSGYSAVALSILDWNFTIYTYSVKASTINYIEFSFLEDGEVYGYYLTDSNGNLLTVERFRNAPISVYNDGKKLKVRPSIELY